MYLIAMAFMIATELSKTKMQITKQKNPYAEIQRFTNFNFKAAVKKKT